MKNMNRRALVTGITGQDGSYLAEILVREGWEVFGTVRPRSTAWRLCSDHWRLRGIADDRVTLVPCDLLGYETSQAFADIQPTHIWHLAADSFVPHESPNNLIDAGVIGAASVHAPGARFYYAGTSEVFGNEPAPQSLKTHFRPLSRYASCKSDSINIIRRRNNPLWSIGILFNHESPRRGPYFVTSAIIRQLVEQCRDNPPHGKRIATVNIGNGTAIRDWGWSPDYAEAMYRINTCEGDKREWIVGTGVGRTVEQFGCAAARMLEFSGVDFVHLSDLKRNLAVEVWNLTASTEDVEETKRLLQWNHTVTFDDMLQRMISAECDRTLIPQRDGRVSQVRWNQPTPTPTQ